MVEEQPTSRCRILSSCGGMRVGDFLDLDIIMLDDGTSPKAFTVYKTNKDGYQKHKFRGGGWLGKYSVVYFPPNVYLDDLLYSFGAWK